MVEIGQEIDGRYRIERLLGEGGHSTVYRAVQTSVGRPVAIKVMKSQGTDADQQTDESLDRFAERFRREARVLSRLKSPATVTLHDFGRSDEGAFFMALEFVDGSPLTARLGERLAAGRVVTILEQALESLGEAHDHGIVHRDIKPGNLMLYRHRGRRDRLKILDFGIAKVLRSLDEKTLRQITGESTLVGTPRYVAPENATDRDPGPPADLYGLGLVAYELLLGERAVPGGEMIEVLDRHLSSDFQVELPRRPSIPDGLRRLVNRMIRKSLAERYATADAVLADLDALPDYEADYAATASMPRLSATDIDAGSKNERPPRPSPSSGTNDPARAPTPALGPSPRTPPTGPATLDAPSDTPAPGDDEFESGTSSTEVDEVDDQTPLPGRAARERPRPAIAEETRTEEKREESSGASLTTTIALVVATLLGVGVAIVVAA